ncbi:hypothetical protein BKA81DRAFT_352520 [Phyllosticta paracitricarpa]
MTGRARALRSPHTASLVVQTAVGLCLGTPSLNESIHIQAVCGPGAGNVLPQSTQRIHAHSERAGRQQMVRRWTRLRL